ncbi:MAG TPA: patatin family protein [Polyangiales bacterium]
MGSVRGRAALVVEGGAMRGVFSAGVLDVFLEQDFDPFDLTIGTSAGACNLASHVAKQYGRNQRCYLRLMTQRAFIDPGRLWSRKHVMDLDWLWDELARVEPLDVAAIVASGKEFVAVTTSATTGQPRYLTPDHASMFTALKGSCALPILYRGPVSVDGEAVVDGGVSDPIAVAEAYRRGARRIVVVRSRPADVVKATGASDWIFSLVAGSRALGAAIRGTGAAYRQAVEFMQAPPADCQIIQVAPAAPLPVDRTTQDLAALEHTYELGRTLGAAAILDWHALS